MNEGDWNRLLDGELVFRNIWSDLSIWILSVHFAYNLWSDNLVILLKSLQKKWYCLCRQTDKVVHYCKNAFHWTYRIFENKNFPSYHRNSIITCIASIWWSLGRWWLLWWMIFSCNAMCSCCWRIFIRISCWIYSWISVIWINLRVFSIWKLEHRINFVFHGAKKHLFPLQFI